jgi:HAE1 family hydrophobic/amphiphilic exporter-1
MSGIIGRFFFQFGMTVAVAVMVSLFISFTLDPMLSSVWHDPPESRFRRVPWLGRFMAWIERGVDAVHVLYGRVLGWSLGHRKSVIAIAVVTFLASFAIVPLVGTEFVPQADQGFISLRLNTAVGSSLEYTDAKTREVEARLKAFPEIDLAMTTIGTEEGRNYARVNLKLVDRTQRSRAQKDLEIAIRDAIKPIPGIELAIGYDRPIWFNLLGPDPTRCRRSRRRSPRASRRCRASSTSRRRTRRRTRPCRCASTTTSRPTSASPCSRSARRSARSSPATR